MTTTPTDSSAGAPPDLFADGRRTCRQPRDAMLGDVAATLQKAAGGQPVDVPEPMAEWQLAHRGILAEADLLAAYVAASGIQELDEAELDGSQRFPGCTAAYLQHWLCLPVVWDDDRIVLAVATPWAVGEIAKQWQQLMGRHACFYLVRRSLIERLITDVYEQADGPDGLGLDLNGNASEAALRDLASEAPIVRLVNDMFARAVELNASDIHVEPGESELVIRFRVDGILRTIMTPPPANFAAIASRLKLVGGLNIAERRLPQDGRTELQIGRSRIDIRISTVPSLHGESIVLRLLRKDLSRFRLETLGMADDTRASFTSIVQAPHGIVLVVGPTGSGKTTTLYCAMGLLNTAEKKVITIEDPVEYQIPGVTQIQVKPSIGLTFADGLRHIVRQDPDIILIGEIRDRETAEIAIHAALTGHLVLSTLHTNDAVGAVSRLLDMGVEDYLLSSSLIGVLSQRLVRRVCQTCGGHGQAGDRDCRTCLGTGFADRLGIFEYLPITERIRAAIRDGADSTTLNAVAIADGMRPLAEDGARLVALRHTTASEITRVTHTF